MQICLDFRVLRIGGGLIVSYMKTCEMLASGLHDDGPKKFPVWREMDTFAVLTVFHCSCLWTHQDVRCDVHRFCAPLRSDKWVKNLSNTHTTALVMLWFGLIGYFRTAQQCFTGRKKTRIGMLPMTWEQSAAINAKSKAESSSSAGPVLTVTDFERTERLEMSKWNELKGGLKGFERDKNFTKEELQWWYQHTVCWFESKAPSKPKMIVQLVWNYSQI